VLVVVMVELLNDLLNLGGEVVVVVILDLFDLFNDLGGEEVVVVVILDRFDLFGDLDLLLDALFNLRGRREKCCYRGCNWRGLGKNRNLDLDLFVHVCLGSCLGLLVSGREDAERNRDTGFKVQVGGL
jgi:hypothetical protein